MTDLLGSGLKGFTVHEVEREDGGYNYYGFIHRTGRAIVMRESLDLKQYRFARAGNNLVNWADRASLEYKLLSEVI